MKNYKMWIDGKWVDADSGKTFTVVNPATEEEIAEVPLGGKTDVDKAVAAAKKAFPIWSRLPQTERSQVTSKIAAAIQEHAEELIELDTLDHGSPRFAAAWMVSWAIHNFKWAASASKAMTGDLLQQIDPGRKIILQREPIGVSALITPWNVPLVAFAAKLGASMAVGNTCVVKPPSIDALSSMRLAEILDKLDIPTGVVNIITGPGSSVGEALASHPDVGLISFTGSCEVGKRIMELGSQTMKRLQLELGGKNPVLVLEDANVDTAVAMMLMMQYENVGQTCASPGRYYLHEKVHDEFIEKFVAGAKKIVVGDPKDEKTQMGPLASAEQRDRVEGYIKSGIAEGAKLVIGGTRPTEPPLDKGYFLMPTVFTGIKQKMTIGREEIFGPVACFMEPFTSEDEAIEMVNDSSLGLTSYVWTGDTARGIRIADRICAGTVNINKGGPPGPETPWTGFKESGLGIEGTDKYGLEAFTQLKHISVDLNP